MRGSFGCAPHTATVSGCMPLGLASQNTVMEDVRNGISDAPQHSIAGLDLSKMSRGLDVEQVVDEQSHELLQKCKAAMTASQTGGPLRWWAWVAERVATKSQQIFGKDPCEAKAVNGNKLQEVRALTDPFEKALAEVSASSELTCSPEDSAFLALRTAGMEQNTASSNERKIGGHGPEETSACATGGRRALEEGHDLVPSNPFLHPVRKT